MRRVLQVMVLTLTMLLGQVGVVPIVCSSAHAQTVQIPSIGSTNSDPAQKIKTFGATIAQYALITVTVITAIVLAVALGYLAASRPVPRMFIMPLFAGVGATCIGWVLNLIFS